MLDEYRRRKLIFRSLRSLLEETFEAGARRLVNDVSREDFESLIQYMTDDEEDILDRIAEVLELEDEEAWRDEWKLGPKIAFAADLIFENPEDAETYERLFKESQERHRLLRRF